MTYKQVVELRVQRIGIDGDGIAQWCGDPVYLPFSAVGDHVRAVLTVRRGGGYQGRVIEMLAAGEGRARPPCRHFGRCGGCALQHLAPDVYQSAKLDGLRKALVRVRVDPGVIQPLRRVKPARRRARLGLMRPRDPRQPGKVGFREHFRHEIVDLKQCLVLEEPLFALGEALRSRIAQLLSPGSTAEASLTRTDAGIDLLLTSAEKPGLGALEALAALGAECDLARIVWLSPFGEMPIIERRPVYMIRSGARVPFPPGAFLQASESAEAILIEEVIGGIGLRRPALDLYAGLGSFGFALADAGPMHLVEGDERSALALTTAARHLAGVTVEQRDLARDPLPSEALASYAAAVFDPPRAGAASQVEALAQSSIEAVVAVSCNPATFARDAAKLIAGGFRLDRVIPIDQFVWTQHLEIVALFYR
ncbi:MAG: class I SAM-dependent RNA methyltransferase [Alphaproteobacteria bacterium]|nr:class I SAM-dependent RNA methyltransferase [Alphaproteobacteria bacterium]